MKKGTRAFTLIEILVVIAIIGVLASVLFANFGEGAAEARDTQRKADLRTIQSALELYKQKYKRYPEGCNGANSWSGQKTSVTYKCTDGKADYIRGNAGRYFTPEFMPALPSDPRLNGNDSGYIYVTNADGTVYKLMARKTVESETLDPLDEFQSCARSLEGWDTRLCYPTSPTGRPVEDGTKCYVAMCDYRTSVGIPVNCQNGNAIFETSYGLWGGYALPTGAVTLSDELKVERNTEAIVCK